MTKKPYVTPTIVRQSIFAQEHAFLGLGKNPQCLQMMRPLTHQPKQ